MKPTKVAIVQAAPVLFDKQGSLAKVAEYAAVVAKEGAELVLFPEAFIPAYPRGLSFGMVVGSRQDWGRDHWLMYWENALEIPGPALDFLAGVAKENKLFLVIGVIERDAQQGTLYCSMLYFNPEGQLIQRHRKLKPTGSERLIWGEGRGDDLQVLSTPLGRLGGLICWENYMPLARMALYEQNVQIYLAPTADQRESWQSTMVHIACEGRCFVLACNQYVTKSLYPAIFQEEIKDMPAVLCRGGSVVVSPLGAILAGPLWDEEGVLYATLDLADCTKAKLDFDVCGHYARPDVFDFCWKKDN
ncbi:MAG: carbon-nitrogen hydrolase family protein [Saprospiraceae bacterium]